MLAKWKSLGILPAPTASPLPLFPPRLVEEGENSLGAEGQAGTSLLIPGVNEL